MADRMTERKKLFAHCVTGQESVLMHGNRRIGKSWILATFEDDANGNLGQPFRVVRFDAQGASNEDVFFRGIANELAQLSFKQGAVAAMKTWFKGLWTGSSSSDTIDRTLTTVDSYGRVRQTLKSMEGESLHLVILVDEIAVFCLRLLRLDEDKKTNQLDIFLSQLRDLRLKYKNARWILTGSIGLHWVAKRGGVSGALNDLKILHVKPFDPDDARKFLDTYTVSSRVITPYLFSDDAFDWIVTNYGMLSAWGLMGG